MEYKSRVIIKYINKETHVIYLTMGIHKAKSRFDDAINIDSKWVELDSVYIQMDKIVNIEFLED